MMGDEPAFPGAKNEFENGKVVSLVCNNGMSIRQAAAIQLRVPESGEEWLDAMIRRSRRMDYVAQAMAGQLANPAITATDAHIFAIASVQISDACLAREAETRKP